MRNLLLRSLSELANNQPVLCIGAEPIRDFVDKHYVDPIKGYKYECVLTGNGYEKITVKTADLYPTVTNELIAANGGQIEVAVDGFFCKVYVDKDSGSLRLSVTATAVRPAIPADDPSTAPLF